MNIEINCFTNLDEYDQESWPISLPCKPVIGESMMSNKGKILRIVAIAYTTGGLLRIELHK